jgi:hypothetical protein
MKRLFVVGAVVLAVQPRAATNDARAEIEALIKKSGADVTVA